MMGIGKLQQRAVLGQDPVFGAAVQEHPQIDIPGKFLQLGVIFEDLIHNITSKL